MIRRTALVALLLVGVAACSDDAGPAGPALEAPALLSVVPQGGAFGVDPSTDVVLRFDHALMPGMEAYVDLHEGAVTGPEVMGTWSMGADGTSLRFVHDAPLSPDTEYAVHIGGGMMGEGGLHVDFASHGPGMGGSWATAGMMGGGPGSGMGNGMGQPGGDGQGYHMGEGWQHPDNGSYGMVFTFTTGS